MTDRNPGDMTAEELRAEVESLRERLEGVETEGHVQELALSEGPDVVLLDMRMPGIDGLEVMRQMKQDPRLADIPVIFVSANAQETAKRAALNAGG